MTRYSLPSMSSRLTHRYVSAIALMGSAVIVGLTAAGCSSTPTDTAQTYEARLAEHLDAEGATMYGAFWCPHCADQKDLFGSAVDDVPYVECDPEGENAQPQLCRDKDIEGYPTWEIDGELYPGTRSLEELAQLSNFEDAE